MGDVPLDPNTRAPSPAWLKVFRLVAAFLVAKLALYLRPLGLDLDGETQATIAAGFALVLAAVGTEARDRGWPILRLLVVPLALVSLSSLIACSTFGSAPSSPRASISTGIVAGPVSPGVLDAWIAAAGSYGTLVRGMRIFCRIETAPADVCIAAARATLTADQVLKDTREAIGAGTATDAVLVAATKALEAAGPALRHAQLAQGGQ